MEVVATYSLVPEIQQQTQQGICQSDLMPLSYRRPSLSGWLYLLPDQISQLRCYLDGYCTVTKQEKPYHTGHPPINSYNTQANTSLTPYPQLRPPPPLIFPTRHSHSLYSSTSTRLLSAQHAPTPSHSHPSPIPQSRRPKTYPPPHSH